MLQKNENSSNVPTRTKTTNWSTTSSAATTASSLHPSDTHYGVESLISDLEGELTGAEPTAAEIEWIELAKEFTSKEIPFRAPPRNKKVVRKLQIRHPKRHYSWTTIRRQLNGIDDIAELNNGETGSSTKSSSKSSSSNC
ncbi:unnamed protein product [Caenorhabditis bovis]|uniref:Uncharacterized protein n=1 Tax=Caenorhabditis bovis TaxID=2654633 RepID=A0A8S1EGL6_9PELO|nr:unnamed protein product [Caenorhabditis bovis]